MTRSHTPPAVAFAAASAGIAIYSCMDALMKGLSIASGAYSAVLWRSVAGVLLTGAVFLARRQRWPARKALRLHVVRGLAAGLSVLLFFWGLVRVPMAQGVALTFLSPLIALFLAAALLGERIRRAAILGSVVAAVGVLVIALGQAQAGASADVVLGALAIVLASVLYAYSLILLRRQAQLADPLEVTLFTSLVIGVLLALGAPWLATWPASDQLVPIVGSAILGSISALLLAWSYGRAEAQVLAPVEYTAFVWAALLGYLVFDERVSPFTVAGALLIVGGCLVAVRGAAPVSQSEAGA
ncbi:DMT family transporter [Sphingomonas desiccabilis]|uniref:DMT family transporter n=1 Tax=Sphingomonas desiccabilis TaxID=429134 RepID=A0A4V1QPM0_9SPHN|nr:DMT family transporter [Sphingomonas desiccabilis]MBB3909545.1 S-adenosylmethionine uptake transporter [Sphingomonas desiccabilis]RXZ34267.1 DMT family transporter [Sphingomonas desiccabilis]